MALYRNVAHLVGRLRRDPEVNRNTAYLDIEVERKAKRNETPNIDDLTIIVTDPRACDGMKQGDWITATGRIEVYQGGEGTPDRYDVLADTVALLPAGGSFTNDCFLRGCIARDPERANNGPAKTTICIDRPKRSRDDEAVTDFIMISAGFEMEPELSKYRKGDRLDVQGRLSMRTYEGKTYFEVSVRDLATPSLPPPRENNGRGDRGGNDRGDRGGRDNYDRGGNDRGGRDDYDRGGNDRGGRDNYDRGGNDRGGRDDQGRGDRDNGGRDDFR